MNQSDKFKLLYKIYKLKYKQTKFGTLLYSFNNVYAYSNKSSKFISNESNYYNGHFTGIKWQCVEYARRYLQTVFNVTFSQVESAYEIPNAIFTTLTDNKIIKPTMTNTNHNLFNNGYTRSSLIIWAKDYEHDTPHGHVAVIVSVNKDGIYVAEQNYNNDNHYRYIPYNNIKNVTIISL
jgi:glutathionylspermidine amidase/synthetase